MGWLVTEIDPSDPFATEAMARSYYMMQQLQQQYAFCPPRLIEYVDKSGKRFTPSLAQSTGAIAESRLHVIYQNGTHVYVNRSDHATWTVTDRNGKNVVLPIYGWLVFNPVNEFFEISAFMNGRRIDYVDAAGYQFLDGRGQWTKMGNLGATGSAVIRRREGAILELIDIYGNERIQFRTPARGILVAYSPDGRELGEVKLTSGPGGWKEFKPITGGRRYMFAPMGGG